MIQDDSRWFKMIRDDLRLLEMNQRWFEDDSKMIRWWFKDD